MTVDEVGRRGQRPAEGDQDRARARITRDAPNAVGPGCSRSGREGLPRPAGRPRAHRLQDLPVLRAGDPRIGGHVHEVGTHPVEGVPERLQHLAQERVVQTPVERGVKRPIGLGPHRTLCRLRLHPPHHRVQLGEVRLRYPPGQPCDQPRLHGLAQLEELEEAVLAPVVPGDGTEDQPLDHRCHRHRPDIRPEAVPDLHDAHRLERLERLPHGVTADAQQLHQLGLGGQRSARGEPLVDDQPLDAFLDVVRHPPRTCLRRHRHLRSEQLSGGGAGDQKGEVRLRYPPCALAGGGGHDAAVLVVAELSAGAVLHARVPGRDFAARLTCDRWCG
ncbi:hypothetical protein JOF35_002026 [Streptomyces demainii]|uniref:Uncharacterized protein n=1 Tax=Streptomyces demainii TaxID=588122 RepID=A0ABT9KMT5_9ACTN|nr:hypothetical protein [Streptomyces demainii]